MAVLAQVSTDPWDAMMDEMRQLKTTVGHLQQVSGSMLVMRLLILRLLEPFMPCFS